MAIVDNATGTVTTQDISKIVITRAGGGDLRGTVHFFYRDSSGAKVKRKAAWTMSVQEKQAVVDNLLAGAKQAIRDEVGL